jgi:CheY-like chemotaxis protein
VSYLDGFPYLQAPSIATAARLLGGLPPDSDPDETPGQQQTSDARREREARAVPHVLIVEDEMFLAWHVEDIVRGLDMHVCGIAARGEDAVARAPELRPDLALMDVHLGGEMDGIEAAERIKAIDDIPVVFITAYSDPAIMARIAAIAPQAQILAKPVTAEALSRAILAALRPAAT